MTSELLKKYSHDQVSDTCSSVFRRYIGKVIKPRASLNYQKLASDIQTQILSLADLETFLMQFMDHQDGINTVKVLKENYLQHNIQDVLASTTYLRDATEAIPLSQRIKPNHFIHNVSNLFLRSLNIVGGVQTALDVYKEKYQTLYPGMFTDLKNKLTQALLELIQATDTLEAKRSCWNKTKKLDALEAAFNEKVLKVLGQAGLAEGMGYSENPSKEYQALLMHYRYLGSTLKASPAVKTISLVDDKTIVQTVDPIVEKTYQQKKAMKERIEDAGSKKPNDPYALANQAFLDRLMADDSQLSPQLRFAFPDTVRQAFQEKTEIFDKTKNVISSNSVIRSASTAYVGRDLANEQRLEAAERNLEQIESFAKNKAGVEVVNLHHMPLLESTKRRHHQDIMCNTMRKAAKNKGAGFSLMPVSFFAMVSGWFGYHKAEVPAGLLKSERRFSNDSRMEQAAHMALHLNKKYILVYGCASNQNRAGTVALTAAAQQLVNTHNANLSFKNAADVFATSGHETFAAAVTCPGSRGMKAESKKSGLFSSLADLFFYGGAAHTRTRALVPKARLPSLNARVSWAYNKDSRSVKLKSRLMVLFEEQLNDYLRYRGNSTLSQKKCSLVNKALADVKSLEAYNFEGLVDIIDDLVQGNEKISSGIQFSFFNPGTGRLGQTLSRIQTLRYACQRSLRVSSVKEDREDDAASTDSGYSGAASDVSGNADTASTDSGYSGTSSNVLDHADTASIDSDYSDISGYVPGMPFRPF